jgi:hypothetical protein
MRASPLWWPGIYSSDDDQGAMQIRPSSFPISTSSPTSMTLVEDVAADTLAVLDGSDSPSSQFESEDTVKNERPELASAK